MVNDLIVHFLTMLSIVRTQMAFEMKKIYHRMELVCLEDDIHTFLKHLHGKQIQENRHEYDNCKVVQTNVVMKYCHFVLYSTDLRCNPTRKKRNMKMTLVEAVLMGQEVVDHNRVWLMMVRKSMMSHYRLMMTHSTYRTFYPKTCLR